MRKRGEKTAVSPQEEKNGRNGTSTDRRCGRHELHSARLPTPDRVGGLGGGVEADGPAATDRGTAAACLGWLAGWLAGCLSWLAACLAGWLAACLAGWPRWIARAAFQASTIGTCGALNLLCCKIDDAAAGKLARVLLHSSALSLQRKEKKKKAHMCRSLLCRLRVL